MKSDGVGEAVTQQYEGDPHNRYAPRFCDAPSCWRDPLAWSNGAFLCKTHAKAYGVIE